ncbi:MAG: alpha/beta hydrolase [Phycisphaerales bacterium]|nr:alpha/beta hydrolase [Phycisphaerales bacterium]
MPERGRNLRLRFLCAFAAAVTAFSTVTPSRAVELVYNVPFASPGSPFDVLQLDLYRPTDDDQPSKNTTIVLLYGGSYDSGRKEDLSGYGYALAELGYTVILPNYTLTTPGAPSFPQAIRDTLNAVYWARTTGALMHDVPIRLVVGGFSAGSTIAMAAALAAPQFATFPPSAQRGYVIDGALGMSGRYDLVWNISVGIPLTVANYVGTPVYAAGWIGAYTSASAITYVNACSPPTVLFHGSHDPLIPANNAVRLGQALTTAMVPNEVNIVSSLSHDPAGVLGASLWQRAQRVDQAVQFMLQNAQAPCGRTPTPPPPPPSGACCMSSGACDVVTQVDCGGQWQRGGTCNPSICPQPGVSGACCVGATCVMMTPENCIGPRTHFTGSGVACGTLAAAPCCRADFNQDGVVAVSDIFDFLNLWFIGNTDAAISTNGQSLPVIEDVFQYLNAWFVGCP